MMPCGALSPNIPTPPALAGNDELGEAEKSAAAGTNCRSGGLFQISEDYNFIGLFTMAYRLLIHAEGA
jgi:hypothetical protein